jgi:septum formation protein
MEMAGYPFKLMASDEEEEADPAIPVHEVPAVLAVEKAEHILPRVEVRDFFLLTADTLVILDGRIIGKPANRDDARRILSDLSGHTHEVVSGVCICNHDHREVFSDLTRVHFSPLSSAEIDHYVRNFEVMDKAGAYAIQEGIGLTGVDAIEGSYYNVMGLPIHKVHRVLQRLGIHPVR